MNNASTVPRVIVITGYGLNCEAETAVALETAGAAVDRVHLNDLLVDPARLKQYGLLAIGGGFSFGDHLGAGRALAIRIKYRLAEALSEFVREGGLVLGICNGFQVLCKLGLLPGFEPYTQAGEQLVTLSNNDCGTFRDDWVRLTVDPDSPCIFTKGLQWLELPVRHGEGKFVARDEEMLERLREQNQIVYQYADAGWNPTQEFPDNPNGSQLAIAGICDVTGRIFGTMPHPEAFIYPEHHPDAPRLRALGDPLPEPFGMRIFRNAVEYIRDEAELKAE